MQERALVQILRETLSRPGAIDYLYARREEPQARWLLWAAETLARDEKRRARTRDQESASRSA